MESKLRKSFLYCTLSTIFETLFESSIPGNKQTITLILLQEVKPDNQESSVF